MITFDEAHAALEYNPETGRFRWKLRGPETFPHNTPLYIQSAWNTKYAGREAGSVAHNGYIQIRLNGKNLLGHRLAKLILSGMWPLVEVDHINGDRSDNRARNLRDAVRMENAQNTGIRSNNKSGYIGVSWNKKSKKWVAQICVNGVKTYIGLFLSKDEAASAYRDAKATLHTFQPNVRDGGMMRRLREDENPIGGL